MNEQRFFEKLMVITGAAQGIGKTVAQMASDQGAIVVLVDRSKLVYELKDKLLDEGSEVLSIIADLEHYSECSRVMDAVVSEYGRIDVLVNNVGGAMWMQPFEEYSKDQIEAEIKRSLFPTLWCCRAVIPIMQKSSKGVIVNVSSIATRGIYRIPYSAAKGGVDALTACLAYENAKKGIRVNAVAAGGTEAEERRIPRNDSPVTKLALGFQAEVVQQSLVSSLMGRYGTSEEQASVILFLASDESSYITGSTIPVGGGDLG